MILIEVTYRIVTASFSVLLASYSDVVVSHMWAKHWYTSLDTGKIGKMKRRKGMRKRRSFLDRAT